MTTIWKYSLEVSDVKDFIMFNMPAGAKVISVGKQTLDGHEYLCLWTEVEPGVVTVPTNFVVRGTGHKLTGYEGRFLGTVSFLDDSLILHVYESTA